MRVRFLLVVVTASLFAAATVHQGVAAGSNRLSRKALDAVRAALRSVQPLGSRYDPQLPAEFLATIKAGQPATGKALLALATDPDTDTRLRAQRAILSAPDLLTRKQQFECFRSVMEVRIVARPWYPHGLDAFAQAEYGSACLHTDKVETVSRVYLDGKEIGEPFRYEGPAAGSGVVPTKDLAIGRHTVWTETNFSVTIGGQTERFSKRSARRTFWIDAADSHDELRASSTPELVKLVQNSIQFSNYTIEEPDTRFAKLNSTDPPPQTAIKRSTGETLHYRTPLWRLRYPVPVDLCFDVTIEELESHRQWHARWEHVPSGSNGGALVLIDDIFAFAEGRTGKVPVKIILTPSQGLAYSNPDVTQYYPEQVVSGDLYIEILGRDSVPTDPRK